MVDKPRDEEISAAMKGSATLANRVTVMVGDSGVRIAFLECYGPGEETHFRTAVVMSESDALELCSAVAGTIDIVREKRMKYAQEQHEKLMQAAPKSDDGMEYDVATNTFVPSPRKLN